MIHFSIVSDARLAQMLAAAGLESSGSRLEQSQRLARSKVQSELPETLKQLYNIYIEIRQLSQYCTCLQKEVSRHQDLHDLMTLREELIDKSQLLQVVTTLEIQRNAARLNEQEKDIAFLLQNAVQHAQGTCEMQAHQAKLTRDESLRNLLLVKDTTVQQLQTRLTELSYSSTLVNLGWNSDARRMPHTPKDSHTGNCSPMRFASLKNNCKRSYRGCLKDVTT